jgi:hypothetical protein
MIIVRQLEAILCKEGAVDSPILYAAGKSRSAWPKGCARSRCSSFPYLSIERWGHTAILTDIYTD